MKTLTLAVADNHLIQVLMETESTAQDLLVVGDPVDPYTPSPYIALTPYTDNQFPVALSLMLGSEQ